MMLYICCSKQRREAVIESALNGIDFIEVQDDPTLPNEQRQKALFLHFLKPLTDALTLDNIAIHGGERITDISVTSAVDGSEPNILEVAVDQAGDFSIYTLCLVESSVNPEVPSGFDTQSASVDFSFKVECPSDFDCVPKRVCPPEIKAKPPINYLAKDYASFRRLMLDRMSLIAPDWQRRNAADLGMTLIEILAYVGDKLSYQQDAIQTEGYLDLARQRVSVKRHARLVDYYMHDGCNSRTWLQIEVDANMQLDYADQFLTALDKTDLVIEPHSRAYQKALKQNPLVFEAIKLLEEKQNPADPDVVKTIDLFTAHNLMHFYTWSDELCCLTKGSTMASLEGHFLDLEINDILVFEEIMGPLTGAPEDANIDHRHAVKVIQIEFTVDPISGQDVTNITWHRDDAMPFALCISAQADSAHGNQLLSNVSVVRGNIVLCDHGQSISETLSPAVPEPVLYYPPINGQSSCKHEQKESLPIRYRPILGYRPLTRKLAYNHWKEAATSAMNWNVADAIPAISLIDSDARPWVSVHDLLNSTQLANDFVADTNNDGITSLRFGNDIQGRLPEPGSEFIAHYRVGNGRAGNIGADAIQHIVTLSNNITAVRNILPAIGGTNMESTQSVRQKAPFAYRSQERAVTEADYAEVSERKTGIQKAQATFRWTGSWHTVFLTADREQGLAIDDAFSSELREHVEKYRMAGYDLHVDDPHFVPLEITMQVCVKPQYFRSEVKLALLDIFNSKISNHGRQGIFHPDNYTFGEPVYLSPLYAAAQAIPGVESVHITKFQRLNQDNNDALNAGRLDLDRLEIAQLNNDPNFRERGEFDLEMGGGK